MAGREENRRLDTSGGSSLGHNPFGALGELGDLPSGPATPSAAEKAVKTSVRQQPNLNRGRVEIRRLTGGRGGKTVTAISGFVGIGLPEKERLAKQMQKACGCGGTVKDGVIEIQGDKREQVATLLSAAGFKPVMAGG